MQRQGSQAVFTYTLKNTGNDALNITSLIDDNGTVGFTADDFAPTAVTTVAGGRTYNAGDSNKNGLLDRTETWLFTASRTVTEGAYSNVAQATATNTRTLATLRDDDLANIYGALARIDVEKAINPVDPANPSVAEDADNPAQPYVLNLGTPIVYSYLLRNTGNGALSVGTFRDDAATPGNTADDFTPTAVLVSGFNIGDTDRDNLLDVGEVWRYTSALSLVTLGLQCDSPLIQATDGKFYGITNVGGANNWERSSRSRPRA